jgi:hypothetical protein
LRLDILQTVLPITGQLLSIEQEFDELAERNIKGKVISAHNSERIPFRNKAMPNSMQPSNQVLGAHRPL